MSLWFGLTKPMMRKDSLGYWQFFPAILGAERNRRNAEAAIFCTRQNLLNNAHRSPAWNTLSILSNSQ